MSAYLIDTNILVRLLLPHDPLCPVATSAVDELKRRDEKVCIAPQNLIELWSVATRPINVNGLGMEPNRVSVEVDRIEKMFRLISRRPSTLAGVVSSVPMPCVAAKCMMRGSWRRCSSRQSTTSSPSTSTTLPGTVKSLLSARMSSLDRPPAEQGSERIRAVRGDDV